LDCSARLNVDLASTRYVSHGRKSQQLAEVDLSWKLLPAPSGGIAVSDAVTNLSAASGRNGSITNSFFIDAPFCKALYFSIFTII